MSKDVMSFKMSGAAEIDKLLSKLPVAVQAKILKRINEEGAKIVQQEIIRNAPSGSAIPDEIKIKPDKENPTGVFVTPTDKVFFARFIEYGTVKRTTKDKENRGAMIEKPFIRQAIATATPKAAEFISSQYGELVLKYLEKEVKSVNRKNKQNGL